MDNNKPIEIKGGFICQKCGYWFIKEKESDYLYLCKDCADNYENPY